MKMHLKDIYRKILIGVVRHCIKKLGMRSVSLCRMCEFDVRMNDGSYVCDNGCRLCEFSPSLDLIESHTI